MQIVRNIADLNHFGHALSIDACGAHVNVASEVHVTLLDEFQGWLLGVDKSGPAGLECLAANFQSGGAAMQNSRIRVSYLVFAFALTAATLSGQQPKSPQPSGGSGNPTASGHIACWKQIGISPAAMQQRRAILEGAKAKVQGVCKDESLTQEQKKEQIHQIHQEARQQADGVIPAAQMEALKKCQHAQSAASATTRPPRTTGPCGEPLEPEDDPAPQPN
jgi:hypothetical protein